MMQKKLSIITACFNAENALKKTIESVLAQKCSDIEYIIVDGGSTDGTVDLINEYQARFEDNNIDFLCVSEKDQGVYDAMNKGVKLASGKWIELLNAGDTYVNDGILNVIIGLLDRSEQDICYGDYILSDVNGDEKYMKTPPLADLKKEMMIGHESSFFRASVHKNNLYSLKYRIAADYDLFLRLYLSHHSFEYLPVPVIRFVTDGISTKQSAKSYTEMQQVRIDNHLIKDNKQNRNLIRRNALRHKIYDEYTPKSIRKIWEKIHSIG